MNKITKTIFIIFTYLSLFSTTLFAQSNGAKAMDASRLTDNLAQSVSLSEEFFSSFSNFVNDLCFQEEDSFLIKNQFDFDGAWFTGFDIYTDYGTQKGSLAQGYGDYIFGLKTKKITLGLGTGGDRFGVFLTNISFNMPSDDPVGHVLVTDFSGTQIMNDIFAGVLGINDIFWAGGYFFTAAEYTPSQGGTLSLFNSDTRVSYWGLKAQFSNILFANALLTESRFQTLEWFVNPLALTLFCLRKSLKLDLDLTTGIQWKDQKELIEKVSDAHVDWSVFQVPFKTAYYIKTPKNKITLLGGLTLGIRPRLSSEAFDIVDGHLGFKHKFILELPSEESFGYNAGYAIKASYYKDKALEFFGNDHNNYSTGFEANLFFEFDQYFTITGGWRWNWFEDLKPLPESKDKHVFALDFTVKM
ncbi:MAG: hypothetical protein MJ188_08195 [Treponema sp.]|nr:hypothetical protein [Treponema sp.]